MTRTFCAQGPKSSDASRASKKAARKLHRASTKRESSRAAADFATESYPPSDPSTTTTAPTYKGNKKRTVLHFPEQIWNKSMHMPDLRDPEAKNEKIMLRLSARVWNNATQRADSMNPEPNNDKIKIHFPAEFWNNAIHLPCSRDSNPEKDERDGCNVDGLKTSFKNLLDDIIEDTKPSAEEPKGSQEYSGMVGSIERFQLKDPKPEKDELDGRGADNLATLFKSLLDDIMEATAPHAEQLKSSQAYVEMTDSIKIFLLRD